MKRNTVLSSCKKYRYQLWREWGVDKTASSSYVVFVGLNPSTADESTDDPTLRRCIGFSQDWGYESLCMVNLFAYRTTNPKNLRTAKSPVGKRTNRFLLDAIDNADIVVAAWGNNGMFLDRDKEVMKMITRKTYCLGLTKYNQPKHPLYIQKKQSLIEFKCFT